MRTTIWVWRQTRPLRNGRAHSYLPRRGQSLGLFFSKGVRSEPQKAASERANHKEPEPLTLISDLSGIADSEMFGYAGLRIYMCPDERPGASGAKPTRLGLRSGISPERLAIFPNGKIGKPGVAAIIRGSGFVADVLVEGSQRSTSISG
jgi:hypothetical protein